MADEKPKLGFEVTQELRKEFMKIGTAGYPIKVINKASGQVFKIVGYETEKVTKPEGEYPNQYQTWIMVEEES